MSRDPHEAQPEHAPAEASAKPTTPEEAFWSASVNLEEVRPPEGASPSSTLERLMPSPFPKSGFPLIGFLATVYDHVAHFARHRASSPISHGADDDDDRPQAKDV